MQGLTAGTRTMIFYESPQRLAAFLREAAEIFGDRQACVVRELTKVHEEILRGSLSELDAEISGRGTVLGEVTIVIGGGPKTVELSVEEAVREALGEGAGSARDLAREIAGRTGLSRKEVYAEILRQPGEINAGGPRTARGKLLTRTLPTSFCLPEPAASRKRSSPSRGTTSLRPSCKSGLEKTFSRAERLSISYLNDATAARTRPACVL